MKYTQNDFELIDNIGFCCVNCGAFSETIEDIKHHKDCKPGESERWVKYYEEAEEVISDQDYEKYLKESNHE